jgi:hypothetical protein
LQSDLPPNQTEDLGKDLFFLDFTQAKWHVSPSVEQAKDAYIAQLRAQKLPQQKSELTTAISNKDEFNYVVTSIKNSSVVPEGPNQRYHIVSMEWYKRWQQHVS